MPRLLPKTIGAPRRYIPYIGWGLLVFTVLFWRLGAPSFWDPDEAHYAQTTHELMATGDWLAPYYNEQPFFDKPPLFHVLQAVPMWLLGPTELAARLVPALAALALVVVTWWLGATLVSADVGLVAALFLTTNPGVFALARYAILETVFTAFVFGGASLVAVAALGDRPRLQYGGYVLIGLAVLTKGPLAIVLCGLSFILAIVLSADARRRLLALRWVVGLLIVLAISLPWFIYMWQRFDQAFVVGYLLNENVRLFARPLYQGQPAWWFYFQILAAGLLPWTGLVLGRLYDDLRAALRRGAVDGARREGTPDTVEVLLWAWTAAVVGFFTVSQFKLDHYVFPAAPALAILCARAWSDLRASSMDALNAGARLGFRLVGPILVAVGLGGGGFIIARLELPGPALVVPTAMTVAGAIVTMRSTFKGLHVPRAPWIALTAMGITYGGLVLWVMPALEHFKVVPDLARWVARHTGATDRVASYRLNRWNTAFRFYVARHTEPLEDLEEARRFFERPEPFYCAMLAPAYDELVAQRVPLRVVYSRDGMWITSGRALWRRKIPATRFVVVARADPPPQ